VTEPIIPPYCPPKPWLQREPWYPVDAPLKGELPARARGTGRSSSSSR